jgi:hypothetical protein
VENSLGLGNWQAIIHFDIAICSIEVESEHESPVRRIQRAVPLLVPGKDDVGDDLRPIISATSIKGFEKNTHRTMSILSTGSLCTKAGNN